MYKILVVDDESKIAQMIASLIEENFSNVEVVGTAHNVIDAIKMIHHKKPNLVLLDIEMPHANGFDLLESIPDRTFQVIFITAYNQYAINAIKENALDYLLKPIDIDDLVKSIERAMNFKVHTNSRSIENLVAHFNTNKERKIKINTKNTIEYLTLSSILKVEADGNYSKLFLKDGSILLATLKIGEIELLINSPCFYRSHKSFIINLSEVSKYDALDNLIEMSDHTKVGLSRSKRTEFLEKMDQWLTID